jgi:hypothetical protein
MVPLDNSSDLCLFQTRRRFDNVSRTPALLNSPHALERASTFVSMSSHGLNDFTGRRKTKIKKPGAKKRRSYRKPIGQNYRKSVATTAQPVREDFLENPSWKSFESWWGLNFLYFILSMEFTLFASSFRVFSSLLPPPVTDYIVMILGLGTPLIISITHLKAKALMALPSILLSIFVLIYFFGFGESRPIYNTPHYHVSPSYAPQTSRDSYNTAPRNTPPRDYTKDNTPRDYALAPRDHESSPTVGGITHHDNLPPDYYNTPDVGDTALCRDGTYSYSQHARGTCSHHSGVLRWDHYPGIIIPGGNPNPPTFFNYKFEPSVSVDIGGVTGIEKYQIQTIDRIPGTPVCQKPMVWTEHDGCQPKSRNR